jgi:hypothetical protein
LLVTHDPHKSEIWPERETKKTPRVQIPPVHVMIQTSEKFPSRSAPPRLTFAARITMTKPTLHAALAAALALSAGCLFSKKSDRPKETSAISSEVEETFRQRWVDKRTSELTAQGTAAPAARAQAEQEFRERYAFNRKEKK